ncbi:MAG: CHAD domain-containing protein [Methylobacter sp.]
MAQEIERKYLVQSDAWRDQTQSKANIQQGYLSVDEKRNVRIRIEEDQAFLTIKGKPNGHTRAEYEYPIPTEDAKQIVENLCLKPLITKTRHKIPMGKLTWEVDEFAGENSPLVLAEVETRTQKPPQGKPDWVGDEVSDDSRYLNINLVDHPYSDWADQAHRQKTKFYLKRSESVAHGLKRILTAQLEAAIEQLKQYESSPEESVHEARKSIKKVRSTLRLMRPVFNSGFAKENDALRDIGRKLSEIRDAYALIETFDYLNANYRDELGDDSLTNLRQTLLDRRQAQTEGFDSAYRIPQLVEDLQQICKHAKAWPYKAANIDLLAEGIATTLRRGRNRFHEAYDTQRSEIFHEWRKRTKDLRYQLSLLQKLWPDVFQGYLESTKTLEKLLGMDHNLVVLRDTLLKDENMAESDQERQLLLPIIDQEQDAGRKKAKRLGVRIYSEKPKQWMRRIRQSWAA